MNGDGMVLFTRAIVTGGSSGIGAGLVKVLLKAGVEVISLSRTETAFSAQETAGNLWTTVIFFFQMPVSEFRELLWPPKRAK